MAIPTIGLVTGPLRLETVSAIVSSAPVDISVDDSPAPSRSATVSMVASWLP